MIQKIEYNAYCKTLIITRNGKARKYTPHWAPLWQFLHALENSNAHVQPETWGWTAYPTASNLETEIIAELVETLTALLDDPNDAQAQQRARRLIDMYSKSKIIGG